MKTRELVYALTHIYLIALHKWGIGRIIHVVKNEAHNFHISTYASVGN